MTVAFYPGSFDPLTLGHVDIISRAVQSFDKIVIGILDNIYKEPLFTPQERLQMIEDTVRDLKLKNVEVIYHQGLAVSYMKAHQIRIMLRGIRVISDFENEMRIAFSNKDLYPPMDTFFLFTNPIFGHVSSSGVKEICMLGGDVSRYVPGHIFEKLKEKYS